MIKNQAMETIEAKNNQEQEIEWLKSEVERLRSSLISLDQEHTETIKNLHKLLYRKLVYRKIGSNK